MLVRPSCRSELRISSILSKFTARQERLRLCKTSVSFPVAERADVAFIRRCSRAGDVQLCTKDMIMQYSSILTFVDAADSLAAVHGALLLARQNHGRVTALRVVELPPELRSGHGLEGWDVLRAELLGHELSVLAASLSKLAVGDAELHAKVVMGQPSFELVQQVLAAGHDLVVKLAAGHAGGRRVAFGSTGLHLVRKCPAPVWLLPRSQEPARRLLAAVHPGKPGDDARYALCRRVLQHAVTVARALQAELHVVHVHERPQGGTTTDLGRRLGEYLVLTEYRVVARLRQVLSELSAEATLHTLHGSPQELVPELAEKLGAHTLFMGSVGHADIPGLFVGDLAEELLLRVECGVFCVKPAGFATPILPREEPSGVSVRA